MQQMRTVHRRPQKSRTSGANGETGALSERRLCERGAATAFGIRFQRGSPGIYSLMLCRFERAVRR